MSESVEFIGGPEDGRVADIPRQHLEYIIPMQQPTMNVWRAFADHLEESIWNPAPFRTGMYRRDGKNPRHMLWMGER